MHAVHNRATTILLAGFGAFPGAPINPTELLVRRLVRLRRPALADLRSIPHVFPTSYAAVDAQLPALIARHQPDAIVLFGLAGRTKGIRVEMFARNRIAQVLPDIDGLVPKRSTIRPHAGTLRGRAPFARLAAAARAAGLSARLSRDAGSYLCNYGYWRALEATAYPGGSAIVVFVHVPRVRGNSHGSGRSPAPTFNQLLRAAQAIVVAVAASVPNR
jgi:pyroglutamyl-peptidase